MARPEKVAAVEDIQARLRDADAAVLTEYRGLTVSAIADLRAALRPGGAEYKIFKNTLARRAAEAADLLDLVPLLEGPVAIAFVKGDAVATAKALRDFARVNPALVLKGGLLGPRVLTQAEVQALANIQPREVLLARLAGGFQAPLAKAAGLFQAFTRNFAYGLKAYLDQRVAAGEALPASEGAEPEATEFPAEHADAAEEPAAPAEEPHADAAEVPAATVEEPQAEAADEPAAAAEEAEPEAEAAPSEPSESE